VASSYLIYRPREGTVSGVVAGRPIRLTTFRTPVAMTLEAWRAADRSRGTSAPHVTQWDHLHEFRPGGGSAGPAGTRLTIADSAPFEIFDYPGEYAQRFDGVDPAGAQARHRHHARVVQVNPASRHAFAIHGLPPCGDPRCIVAVDAWELLFTALMSTKQVSFVVEL